MARPLWTGTLGFGLVVIPIEVHIAVRDMGPRFHFLRRSDRSPIGFQKVAKQDGAQVPNDELVKGYQDEPGHYVVLTPKDFEKAAVTRNSRIDLLDFVASSDIDDRYFDKPYYLLPARGGEHAYGVLREALRQSGRAGIATFVSRDKPHLAAVVAIDNALVLSTLRFHEELVPMARYAFPPADVAQRELGVAHQLIEAMASPWQPDKYVNEHRANLLQIIQSKHARQPVDLQRQEAPRSPKVVDLMERLRRSLDKAGGTPQGQQPTRARHRASKTRRTPARRIRRAQASASTRRPSRKNAYRARRSVADVTSRRRSRTKADRE